MELYQASKQWSSRPLDERFGSLEELFTATNAHKMAAAEQTISNSALRVFTSSDLDKHPLQVRGVGPMTPWAFSQLSRRIGAPPDYLRSLAPTLAENCINYGAKTVLDQNGSAVLLVHKGEQHQFVRAFLTDHYTRVWNADIVNKMFALRSNGWKVPPARPAVSKGVDLNTATPEELAALKIRRATAEDLVAGGEFGLSINEGDLIQPAGLYCSFEDMFIFMVNEKNRINDGTEQGLGKGFFLSNSEVGKQSVTLTTFLYRFVCGNHIVWGASSVTKARFKHVGNIDEKWHENVEVELTAYANESVSDIEAKIAGARKFKLGGTIEETIDNIFKSGYLSRKMAAQVMFGDGFSGRDLSKGDAENGYIDTAVDGDPTTAWAFAQGVTRFSQTVSNADARTALDEAAGKIVDMSVD